MNRRDFIAATAALAAGGAWAAAPATVLVVGDSLSAEYGLRRGTGWVPLLQQRLQQLKVDAQVVNASISGDTSSGGRSRLPALLAQHRPTHVVLELGANDALRGLPLDMTQGNLQAMTQAAQKAGARVLLVGIQLPPNYGPDYGEKFSAMYERIARDNKAEAVPFLLRGIGDAPDAERWFQPDRIHPNEQAQPRLLDNVWPTLARMLGVPGTAARPAAKGKP